jgi:hypothetical protein
MKIYLIGHSVFGYDFYRGHVIIANRESEVRDMAANNCADEGGDVWETADIEECGTYTGGRTEPFILLSDYNAG